jgi:hypothetical protein
MPSTRQPRWIRITKPGGSEGEVTKQTTEAIPNATGKNSGISGALYDPLSSSFLVSMMDEGSKGAFIGTPSFCGSGRNVHSPPGG